MSLMVKPFTSLNPSCIICLEGLTNNAYFILKIGHLTSVIFAFVSLTDITKFMYSPKISVGFKEVLITPQLGI